MFASLDFKKYVFKPMAPQIIAAILSLGIVWEWVEYSVIFLRLSHRDAMPHTQQKPAEQGQNWSSRLSWPIFGVYLPKQLGGMGVKQSHLQLKLVGVLYSSKLSDSQVILQTNEGEEKIFSVGDTLPGGAVLRSISADGILILFHGELEQLSLPKQSLTFEPKPSASLKLDAIE